MIYVHGVKIISVMEKLTEKDSWMENGQLEIIKTFIKMMCLHLMEIS